MPRLSEDELHDISAFIGECGFAARINKAQHSASSFSIASEKYWGGNVVNH